jgi:hypothetical protein
MGSSDPILQLLKDFAYAVVRLPRENIRPLLVLEKQGNDLTVLGELTDLFSAGTGSIPSVGPDQQAAFINGKRTRALDINVGLSLLGGIIGAMTGSKLKLDAAYKKASNLTFEFEDVKVSEVSQLALNKFISGTKPDPTVGKGILKALEDDRLYVITSVVKSKKFKTEATQSSGASVGVDIPVVKEMVSGAVQIKSEGTSDSKVTYEGQVPLVFGFQAACMEFEKGVFKGLKQTKPEEAAVRGAEASGIKREFELLTTEGPFVKLAEKKAQRVKKAAASTKSAGRRGSKR